MFPLALSLLRANVITLCISLGLSNIDLYPMQAMLLNLVLLHRYCIEKANTTENIIKNVKILPPPLQDVFDSDDN